MRIADLTDPVNALKADWLVAPNYIGFTPQGKGADAAAKCQTAINDQMKSGYVAEYITKDIEHPNVGYGNDARHLEERKLHASNAGRLIAVHRLRPSSRKLREIVGDEDYERTQNMWSQNGDRSRWSVAFPIIESFDITTRPFADDILGAEAYQRLIQHPSATLRPLTAPDRYALANLELKRRPASNAWIAIEDDIKKAEGSQIQARVIQNIDRDLRVCAVEGMTKERWAKVRLRAAWLAERFAIERKRAGTLHCDECHFRPEDSTRLKDTKISPRAVLDAHHLHPMEEGTRWTTTADFALLCPTCHRIEHLLIKTAS